MYLCFLFDPGPALMKFWINIVSRAVSANIYMAYANILYKSQRQKSDSLYFFIIMF